MAEDFYAKEYAKLIVRLVTLEARLNRVEEKISQEAADDSLRHIIFKERKSGPDQGN